MRAVIIDDEQKARKLLKALIQNNCSQITEIFMAENLKKGVELIQQTQPEIVFLDVEMPGEQGIRILDYFDPHEINFELIFTTAYSEYAIRAFELNAIDYLLKPLRDEQVESAVKKATQKIGNTRIEERMSELKKLFQSTEAKKIALPMAEGILFLNFEEIVMFRAERSYTKVFTSDDNCHLISKPLAFFKKLLENTDAFYSPHRSFLINLRFIKKYVSSEGGYIIMDNGQEARLSRDKKAEFFKVIGME